MSAKIGGSNKIVEGNYPPAICKALLMLPDAEAGVFCNLGGPLRSVTQSFTPEELWKLRNTLLEERDGWVARSVEKVPDHIVMERVTSHEEFRLYMFGCSIKPGQPAEWAMDDVPRVRPIVMELRRRFPPIKELCLQGEPEIAVEIYRGVTVKDSQHSYKCCVYHRYPGTTNKTKDGTTLLSGRGIALKFTYWA